MLLWSIGVVDAGPDGAWLLVPLARPALRGPVGVTPLGVRSETSSNSSGARKNRSGQKTPKGGELWFASAEAPLLPVTPTAPRSVAQAVSCTAHVRGYLVPVRDSGQDVERLSRAVFNLAETARFTGLETRSTMAAAPHGQSSTGTTELRLLWGLAIPARTPPRARPTTSRSRSERAFGPRARLRG